MYRNKRAQEKDTAVKKVSEIKMEISSCEAGGDSW